MKLFIQVLDQGYTLSVTRTELPGDADQPVEVKRKYAFETKFGLTSKLIELGIIQNPDEEVA